MNKLTVNAVDLTQRQYQIRCFGLPLAIYREVAVHLRQVPGVKTEMLPQESTSFEYQLSQVGGLRIQYAATADLDAHRRVEQILTYYGDRYGAWEVINPPTSEVES